MRHQAFVELLPVVELPAVVIAMLAIIVLAGLYLIIELFHSWFGRIPWIGPIIGPALDTAAHAMRTATLWVWHGTLWALTHTLQAIMWTWRNMVAGIRVAIDDIVNAVEHQAYVVIPRKLRYEHNWQIKHTGRALFTALQYGRYVLRTAQQLAAHSIWFTGQQIIREDARIRSTIRTDTQQLQAEIGQVARAAQAGIRHADQLAQSLHAQAEHDLQHGDRQAVSQAVALALHQVDAEAAQAATEVWAGIEHQIAGLETVLGSDFADVTRLLQQVPTVTPGDLTVALAAGMSALPPLMQLAADCTVPTCRDLGPARQLTHLLADAAFMAAMLAWMIYAIADPVSAAQDTVDVTNKIAGPVMDPLKLLLGII